MNGIDFVEFSTLGRDKNGGADGLTGRSRPKILFLVAEDWYFWSHRLPIARAALRSGYEVIVATRVNNCAEKILGEGFRLIPLRIFRESYSVLRDLRTIYQVWRVYAGEKPNIVHHVALKPVLYGSIAAFALKNVRVVNALTGLGYLAASASLKAKLLRAGIWKTLVFLLNGANRRVLLQNYDDKQLVVAQFRVPPAKVVVIRGAGVNVSQFRPEPEPAGMPVVLLASRMLWNKGVKEFVEAAVLLQRKGVTARFVLAGDSDPGSPSAIPRQQLVDWQSSGFVEWWGHQEEMKRVLKHATIVCLPSHREGVPKVLLEAAASGRAIIATDVPGCREIVRDGFNGVLVPALNPPALASAIEELLRNAAVRARMAASGPKLAAAEFSEQVVVQQTLNLYRELLDSLRLTTSIQSAVASSGIVNSNMLAILK